MVRKRLVIMVVIMTTLFMFLDVSAGYAKSLSQLQKEIDAKQAELDKGEAKESSLSKQVNGLEEKIYELQAQIESSEVKLTKLEKELKIAEEKVNTQNENLGNRLRNMYKNGNVGFMDVLMNSSSFSEFMTNLDLVEKIYVSDQDVLQELQTAYDEVEKKKKQVEELKANLEESESVAKAEMAEVAAQKKKIAADNEEKARMLDQMEEESAKIAARLASSSDVSNSNTSKYSGGAFAWPTPGYTSITSPYGWRICPFHGREFHQGIDIGAPGGATVVSAASGRVYSAGWAGGFGNQVIVDHGGGMTTWYNHLSSISVSSGQQVSKGQQVGRVGTTGSSTGNHLDYRVFINGSSKNPLSYY